AARVTDRHDNLVVDGTLVEFGPSTVNLQPPTDTTRNGVARTVFESGPTPGFVTIEARAGQIVRSVRVEVI
ncbi:MAG: hypothetical protein JXA93_09655, partial [Anaerolineae bacterium]|nr:hypothetical protein [Anaerolineae bacterium]